MLAERDKKAPTRRLGLSFLRLFSRTRTLCRQNRCGLLAELHLPDSPRVRRCEKYMLAARRSPHARRYARGWLDFEVHDLVPRHPSGHVPASCPIGIAAEHAEVRRHVERLGRVVANDIAGWQVPIIACARDLDKRDALTVRRPIAAAIVRAQAMIPATTYLIRIPLVDLMMVSFERTENPWAQVRSPFYVSGWGFVPPGIESAFNS